MKNLILLSYKYLPKSLLVLLGSSVILKPIRDLFLRKNRRFIKAVVEIERKYDSFHVSFDYCADLKSAAKAKYHGVEESILRKSIKIIQTRIPTNNAVVFDIGSNFGYLSLVWSQTIASENGIVFSFEPAKNVFEGFKETCLLNGKKVANIKPINIAIGNEVGNIELKDFGTTSNVISQSYLSREK